MIDQAQPKGGLETGGLVSGSEAARARVALNYEDDLAGKNGPTARFDTLRELIGTEISAALNEMRFTAGDGSSIFGREGHFTVATNPKARGKGLIPENKTVLPDRWDIEIVDFATGTIQLARAGTIIKDDTDVTAGITIASVASTFNPTSGQTLRLRLTGPFDTPVVTLQCGSSPTGYPSSIETTGSGDTAEFTAAYYYLWKFYNSAAEGRIPISSTVYAKKLVGDFSFMRTLGGHQGINNRPFAVPTLVPWHDVLT